MVPYQVPGVQLVFSNKGKVVFDQAYGLADLSEKTSASNSLYHRIASISKVVTRACIERLVKQKKLSRQQEVFSILNEYDVS
jgi:CubicO group peptidase (beta-lactamase class C family)